MIKCREQALENAHSHKGVLSVNPNHTEAVKIFREKAQADIPAG